MLATNEEKVRWVSKKLIPYLLYSIFSARKFLDDSLVKSEKNGLRIARKITRNLIAREENGGLQHRTKV